MGKKQLRLTGSEKICSRNLEVGDIAVGEYTGYLVGILVPRHKNSHPFSRIQGTETANTFGHQSYFVILSGADLMQRESCPASVRLFVLGRK